jgi:flagellar motor protein MotB
MNTAAAEVEAEKEPVKIVSLFDAALHEEDEQPRRHGSPLWMTTFADMITLLLAFFVLILSFSDTNVNRFKDVSGSLQKSLGKQDALPVVVAPPAETQLVAGPTTETAPLPEQLARDLGTLQKSRSLDLVGKKIEEIIGYYGIESKIVARERGPTRATSPAVILRTTRWDHFTSLGISGSGTSRTSRSTIDSLVRPSA